MRDQRLVSWVWVWQDDKPIPWWISDQHLFTRAISNRRSLSTKADNPRSITSGNNSASARTNGHRVSLTGNRFVRFRGCKVATYDDTAEVAKPHCIVGVCPYYAHICELDSVGVGVSVFRVPWTYTINSELNVIFTTGTGVLTDQELFDGVMSLYDDPRFHPDMRGLFDYRGVGTLKVSSETMAKLAAMRRYSSDSRAAFLVNGPLAFGLGRVYQSWVDLGQVKITYDRAEAVAWLNEGVPPEKHIT